MYQCLHCATVEKKCVLCRSRTSDPAGFLLFLGIFMTVAMGLVFTTIGLSPALTNHRLDSAPTTPLGMVLPGGSYKVFALSLIHI